MAPADPSTSGQTGSADVGGGSSGTAPGSDPAGVSGGESADGEAAKSLKGHSVGELLSGGTERVASAKPAASTDAGARAAKAVSEDGGGAGLLWLLLALGAVTAVAAGGVAMRRRQARQSYLN